MFKPQPQVIELVEYKSALFERDHISYELGKSLWQNYRQQICVDFPDPSTNNQWRLTSTGWVGHIPLTTEFHVALQPKVALSNLFYMLEYAYQLKSFHLLEGLINCQSLAEFYEQLAYILAKRVLDRGRKGFYRAYVPQTEQLPYLRGRLDMPHTMRSPERVKLKCHYQDHTADLEENQILVWTLLSILGTGLCTERVLPTIRRAYRTLQGLVTVRPYSAQACVNRLYNRLNNDYRPLHALCRFFLEQSGPGHQLGKRAMLPFLVDMARLFELFVAEWLSTHPPVGLKLEKQKRVNIDEAGKLYFEIDLVLSDRTTGTTRYVLDTKYKIPAKPATDDISQVVSYAVAKRCQDAILIYPKPLNPSFEATVGDIRVRTLAFDLQGDLEMAGVKLGEALSSPSVSKDEQRA